jgi:hypothetical protein
MKRIALIQNQTEMTHYGHADCRRYLEQLNRDYILFTADSIHALAGALTSGEIACALIGTNALHDQVIREYLLSDQAAAALSAFLGSGRGLIVMMQYKAAYENYPFSFLPAALGRISAIPRPNEETAVSSNLVSLSGVLAPPLLTYPNKVDIKQIQLDSREHTSLTGVYWHYWGIEQPVFWDTHIRSNEVEENRDLVISSRDHTGVRVVMSALPLDWHGHMPLFSNVVTYAIDGRHDTALLLGEDQPDLTVGYLAEKLEGIRQPHRVYGPSAGEQAEALQNVIDGVHNTLFLASGVNSHELFAGSESGEIQARITAGNLRVISFDIAPRGTSVRVLGQRSIARDAYELLVPAIGHQLTRGFLDGSFRGTIAGLEELESLPYGLDTTLFPFDRVLEECDRHDRAGSYDEVIGATIALLWLRGKALGIDDPKTQRSLAWLRVRYAATEPRERLQALGVFDALGVIKPAEVKVANSTLSVLNASLATEIELLGHLEAAIRFEREDVARAIICELAKRQRDGRGPTWIDIPTTANLIKLLVVASNTFKALSCGAEPVEAQLRTLVIPAMVAVEGAYHRSLEGQAAGALVVPWDGKISTALRCVSAWHLFDQYLGAPVEEAAEAVIRSARRASISSLAEGAIQSLRDVVAAHSHASHKLQEQRELVIAAAKSVEIEESLRQQTVKLAKRLLLSWLATAILVYLIADHVIRTRWLGESLRPGESLVTHWSFHIVVVVGGFLAVLGTVSNIPWRSAFRYLEQRVGARPSDDPHANK